MRYSTSEIAREYQETALDSFLRISMTMAAMAVGGSVCSGLITLALMP